MIFSSINLSAQIAFPPDFLDWQEDPALFYKNKGQIKNDMGKVEHNIKYYTTGFSPNVYLQEEGKMSFVQVQQGQENLPDTLNRIDMQLTGNVLPDIQLNQAGESADYRNYYLPHCSSGATYCHAYQRLRYKEVYKNIDVDVRASKEWAKFYFVIKPGGNPSDIEFQFTGQDSENIDPYLIELFYGTEQLEIPNAIAYEVGGGNMTILPWTPIFINLGNGKVGFSLGSYNTNKRLVIQMSPPMPSMPPNNLQNINWTTHIGGFDTYNDYTTDVKTDNSGNIYITGTSSTSIDFPSNYQATFNGSFNGDGYTAKFNSNGEILWYSVFGSYGEDLGEKMVVTPGEKVIVAGHTNDLGYTPQCPPNTYCDSFGVNNIPLLSVGTNDIFLFRFDADGTFNQSTGWMTYIGSDTAHDYVSDLILSPLGQVYLIGKTEGANYPTVNPGGSAYFDGVKGTVPFSNGFPLSTGFISEFDTVGVLNWSTFFGIGNNESTINGAGADQYNNLFIWGKSGGATAYLGCDAPTSNAQIPICDPSLSNDFVQTVTGDGFIAKFTNRGLVWSTFFNGIPEKGTVISVENDARLYLAGNQAANNSISSTIPNNSTDFPLYNSENGLYQDNTHNGQGDIFLAKFNGANQLVWSTYFGGADNDVINDITVRNDRWIYFTGRTYSTDFPTQQGPGTWMQSHDFFNGDGDAFISVFDQNLALSWSTYLGGSAGGTFTQTQEQGLGVDIYNDNLHVVGATNTYFFPVACAAPQYCRSPFNSAEMDDGFIFQFDVSLLPTSTQNRLIQENYDLTIYPNPTNGILQLTSDKIINDADILIYNQLGQLLYQQQGVTIYEIPTQLNLNLLEKGIYILQIRSEIGSTQHIKFIKQ
ncbi:MAG: T9SS type A sorting domain-containing protein [Saprospiraceae bacterium]